MAIETTQSEFEGLLRQSASLHRHLCPRQVLGVRLGMCAARIFTPLLPQKNKRMLAMVEMDGCFADGVSVATGCSMGHRTMRLADEGKIAATFIDTVVAPREGSALRIYALPDLRVRAAASARSAPNRWRAYLSAYQQLADEEMFGTIPVRLNFDVHAIVGEPGARTTCSRCGEEILNLREIVREGHILCRSCAGESYWSA
jgi:formylmethanofuran dehydrogenase subunit E